jgi:hypothetical protein
VTIKLINVIIEDNVDNNNAASAQSTGEPVYLLCENGVVNVQPAIVVVKSELTTNVGKNCNKESSFNGIELQLL